MFKPKFLIDENIRRELLIFLDKKGFDVKSLTKGAKDNTLAQVSKKEKRILITNDNDFIYYSRNEVFSVILLKTPQSDLESLIVGFENILDRVKNFNGNIIILRIGKLETIPLEEKSNRF